MTRSVARYAIPHFAGSLYGVSLIGPKWSDLAQFGRDYLNPGDRLIVAESNDTYELTVNGYRQLAGASRPLPPRSMGIAAFSDDPGRVIDLAARKLGLGKPIATDGRVIAVDGLPAVIAMSDQWPGRGEMPLRASVGFFMPRDVGEKQWGKLIDLIKRSPYAGGQVFSCITPVGEAGFAGPPINQKCDPKGLRTINAGEAVTLQMHERSAVPASYHAMRLSLSYFTGMTAAIIPDPLGLSFDSPARASSGRWSIRGGIDYRIFNELKEVLFRFYGGNTMYIWDGERMFIIRASDTKGSRDAVVWRVTYRDNPMGYRPSHHEIRAKNDGVDATVLRSLYASESYVNVTQTYALSASGREAGAVLAIAETVFDEYATRVAGEHNGE